MLKNCEIDMLANKALESGNPYVEKAIKFFIDNKEKYLIFDKVYDLLELNCEYLNTAKKDIKIGYNDRMGGYYDKWYRYYRVDGGRAYDLGVKFALNEKDCPEEINIIPAF